MAKIEWKEPISAIHGKLFKGFGAAKRKTANAKGEQPNYTVFYGKRTTTVSADELAARSRFGTLSAMYKARKNDATKKVADKAAFAAQTAIPTLKAYVWSKCIAELDAENEE